MAWTELQWAGKHPGFCWIAHLWNVEFLSQRRPQFSILHKKGEITATHWLNSWEEINENKATWLTCPFIQQIISQITLFHSIFRAKVATVCTNVSHLYSQLSESIVIPIHDMNYTRHARGTWHEWVGGGWWALREQRRSRCGGVHSFIF